jgi:hypothetical protein
VLCIRYATKGDRPSGLLNERSSWPEGLPSTVRP